MSIRIIRLPYVPRGGIPDSIFTVRGGILQGTGAGTYAELTPGSVGQVPTYQADGSLAPATPSGGGGGVTDHGALGGLGDDDHLQYHTDARAVTWLGTRSTADLPEGSGLYYTDARVASSASVTANTGHRNLTSGNPHQVTAAEAGADPAGTASTAITDHEAAPNPHSQYTTTAEAAAAAPVQSVAGRAGAVTLDAADIAETAALKILTAAERAAIVANTAKFTGETHTITRQVPVAPGEAIDPTTDVFAPFAGTMTVARYVVEGATPAAGTGLTTVVNATTTTTMVNAQDAISGIGATPALLTSASTTVAAGDRITTEVTYAGTVTPTLNSDGVPQSRIGFVYTFTRSA